MSRANPILRNLRSRRGNLAPEIALVAVTLAILAALAGALRPTKEYSAAYQPSEEEQHEINSSALAMILGEVRASLSDFVWVKTELYSHRGIHFAAHEDKKAEDHAGEVRNAANRAEEDTHAGEHPNPRANDTITSAGLPSAGGEIAGAAQTKHADHKTTAAALVIPPPEEDFRGFIGTIQREVQPWGVHNFAQGKEILPWYRVQTLINPKQARAYNVAGWLLMKEKNQPGHLEEAEKFLREGIENNPNYFPLHLMLGRVLIEQKRWDDAIKECEAARDIALKYRPPDGKPTQTWTDSDIEDFGFALRYIPFIQFRMLNDPVRARESCLAGLKYFPADKPLKNFLRQIEEELKKRGGR
ncbi:tetratricopeptide repeat protein [Candidatus Sumerlaeota bacterium]|nr:tetratricopeptide repeat protein [Candidatus Sumerlaeota bacterium]